MEFWQVADRRYARFVQLGREVGLRHAFATRPHDVAARTDAQAALRDGRRRQMAADLGFDSTRLSWCVQVHEPVIDMVRAESTPGARENVDGLVTELRGTPLMTFSADCPLVLLYDPRRRVVGMAHASWRCTVEFMARRLLQSMWEECGCRPIDLLAGIGPSAGACCYEVKEDVYAAAVELVDRDELFPRRDGRMYFDLWQANSRQLAAAGVREENIECGGICTLCENDVFYSFRREGLGCGHFGLLAGLTHE